MSCVCAHRQDRSVCAAADGATGFCTAVWIENRRILGVCACVCVTTCCRQEVHRLVSAMTSSVSKGIK